MIKEKKNFFRDILINEHPPGMISSIFFLRKVDCNSRDEYVSKYANIILSSTTAAF